MSSLPATRPGARRRSRRDRRSPRRPGDLRHAARGRQVRPGGDPGARLRQHPGADRRARSSPPWPGSHDRVLPTRRDWAALALLGLLGVFANQVLYLVGPALHHGHQRRHPDAVDSGLHRRRRGASSGAERLTARRRRRRRARRDRRAGAARSGPPRARRPDLASAISWWPATASATPSSSSCSARCSRACPGERWSPAPSSPAARRPCWSRCRRCAQVDWAAVPGATWLAIAYVGVFPTVGTYALNTWAVRRSSPSVAAAFTTLQPVFTALLATFFLHETFGWLQAAGFGLIVSGLVVVSQRR